MLPAVATRVHGQTTANNTLLLSRTTLGVSEGDMVVAFITHGATAVSSRVINAPSGGGR